MREICSRSQLSPWDCLPATAGGPGDSAKEVAGGLSHYSPAEIGVAILIPAYRPGAVLIDIVRDLRAGDWETVVVVDDGSGADYAPIFSEIGRMPGVQVVPHAVNLGKGSALKAGINFILCAYPKTAGIVTVDADGQHDPADVRKVCARFRKDPDALVLGARTFEGDVPLRSKLGNLITRRVMRVVVGHNLSDSQTGLRAIPIALLPRLLKLPAAGYEFELEMLIAAKHLGLRVIEQPIRTIYEPGNASSHFQPLRDSLRIYFILLRFTAIGVLSAVLDNLVFYLLFRATGSLLESQVGARVLAVLFNYAAVRKAAFLSEEGHQVLLPRYLLLVIANLGISYEGIQLLDRLLPVGVVPAKMMVEAILFIANFAIQRDYVFCRQPSALSAHRPK
jgi:glycosyltransferase involved in cell wall biosynthesis